MKAQLCRLDETAGERNGRLLIRAGVSYLNMYYHRFSIIREEPGIALGFLAVIHAIVRKRIMWCACCIELRGARMGDNSFHFDRLASVGSMNYQIPPAAHVSPAS